MVSLRMPQRRRRSPGLACARGPSLAHSLAIVLLLGTAGCSSDPPSKPRSTAPVAPTAEPTPLADYDTSDLTLDRTAFCDQVAEEAITTALVDEPSDQQNWKPGGRLPRSLNTTSEITRDITRDISNEYGCSWSAGPASALAWVFAPPVTPEQAAHFADDVTAKKCRLVRGATAVGQPGVVQQCGNNTSIYGLVGDAWVGCEIAGLRGPPAARVERVGEWCVAVLEAMRND